MNIIQYRELTQEEKRAHKKEFWETTHEKSLRIQAGVFLLIGIICLVTAVLLYAFADIDEPIIVLVAMVAAATVLLLLGATTLAISRNNYAVWLKTEKNVKLNPMMFNFFTN